MHKLWGFLLWPVKTNDSNNFSLVEEAGDVDMRNVGVVASDHACDQKPRRKRRKEEERKKKEKKKEVIFISMTHNSLWP